MNINPVYQSKASELRESESLLDLESREISSTANMQKPSEVTPRQIMRGHTKSVQGVVPLPGGQLRVITCSFDGSLRLWDLESGAQIGSDWRDDGVKGDTITGVMTIALSPDGKTVASGSQDGTMRLWDIQTRKVIGTRVRHLEHVGSMCWSPDGEELVSGSKDGIAALWMVERGDDQGWITGHNSVYAVSYSPDATMIATSGYDMKEGIKIWDVNRPNFIRHPDLPWGKLLTTIEHDRMVWSLAWTSDGKKLVSGGNGSIRIFDTDTWQQIATLEGHEDVVHAISLFPNDRLLVSASWDNTARIWDFDRNLQVGPSLNHEHLVNCAAFSADGKLLVTGCDDANAYVWDVHAILKEAGLEDLPRAINTVSVNTSLILKH
jgi:WD40 repeat protein